MKQCGNSCGSGKASAADCASQFTAYTTPTSADGDANAHYILGNHYQWNAAAAGTGDTITSGTVSDSICPRNWRLPTSNGGEFTALVTALGGTSSSDNVTKAPFYGVRGGDVDQSTSYLFEFAGDRGRYWSASSYSSAYAYSLTFYITYVYPAGTNARYNRQIGNSVRCVAR